jgi:L-alanine-DL-glutamate epimerase-like enolase superfamily enzyme
MKITRIRWAPFLIPFVSPYETARGSATHRSGVIVVLETASRVRGYGEASLDPAAPQDEAQGLLPYVETIARDLIAANIVDVYDVLEPHGTGNEADRAAHCAIETALADAGAREAGQPLAELLGEDGTARRLVAVNATVAARSTEQAAAAALLASAQGYGCIKLKVGMEPTLAAEAERVKTVREVIGAGVKLRLDANGAWDEHVAIATIRNCEPYDIELVEQPVPAGDFVALGKVRDAVTTSIAADEAVSDYASAASALRHADVLVIKPARLGGLSIAHYIAKVASAAGLGVVVTTTIDTGIGTAAALHLAASLPDEGRAHGLATASLLQDDLLTTPLTVERGYMSLPDAPGLGVDLDEARAAQYLGAWQEVTA